MLQNDRRRDVVEAGAAEEEKKGVWRSWCCRRIEEERLISWCCRRIEEERLARLVLQDRRREVGEAGAAE